MPKTLKPAEIVAPPAIAWDYPNPFVIDVHVQSSHIDGIGHVNNSVYVGWCQDAGWGQSLALGLGIDDYQALDRAMVIRHGEYDYLRAAYLGDYLQVATWLVAGDNRLSMRRRFQIVRPKDGTTLLRGCWQLVCIEMSSGRPRRIPSEFSVIYGAVMIDA